MYDIILFDLDGTLTDPLAGIMDSLRYALRKLGLGEAEDDQLRLFIGPPMADSFRDLFGLDEETTREAIQFYREHHVAEGLFLNTVFPDVPELLELLCQRGKTLCVATTKYTGFAQQVLDYFDLSKYFTLVAGGNYDGTRTGKAELIAFTLQSLHVADKSRVVMIGDRKYDITGAKENGITAVAVTYGYGSVEELQSVAPDFTFNSVAELTGFLGAC